MIRIGHIDGEAGLLRRLQGGDERAFEVLFDRYQGVIYRYALRMSGSPETADDVVQESFLALLRGSRGYDPSAGPLGSYLFGIARNMLFRQMGWNGVALEELGAEPVSGDADPLEGLEASERIGLVRQTLARLPEHYREALVLCDMEEMSYAEAAGILGCPVGTVRSRLSRARALMLERMSKERCGTRD